MNTHKTDSAGIIAWMTQGSCIIPRSQTCQIWDSFGVTTRYIRGESHRHAFRRACKMLLHDLNNNSPDETEYHLAHFADYELVISRIEMDPGLDGLRGRGAVELKQEVARIKYIPSSHTAGSLVTLQDSLDPYMERGYANMLSNRLGLMANNHTGEQIRQWLRKALAGMRGAVHLGRGVYWIPTIYRTEIQKGCGEDIETEKLANRKVLNNIQRLMEHLNHDEYRTYQMDEQPRVTSSHDSSLIICEYDHANLPAVTQKICGVVERKVGQKARELLAEARNDARWTNAPSGKVVARFERSASDISAWVDDIQRVVQLPVDELNMAMANFRDAHRIMLERKEGLYDN
jgi:hypothetical protein